MNTGEAKAAQPRPFGACSTRCAHGFEEPGAADASAPLPLAMLLVGTQHPPDRTASS